LYVDWLWAADGWRLFAGWMISLGLAVLLVLCVDVNVFSLHNAYANRLIRCYLGASRPKIASRWAERRGGAPAVTGAAARREDALTGFDPADDILLSDLKIAEPHGDKQKTYWGPLPIINTALNLVAGAELAWQERKADSFVLTPFYCGSKTTG